MKNESFSPSKLVFTLALLTIVLCAVLDQCGALDWAINHISTGAAGATYRGMK